MMMMMMMKYDTGISIFQGVEGVATATKFRQNNSKQHTFQFRKVIQKFFAQTTE